MTTTSNTLNEVKIYVGTYAKYNNGSIAGEWLTLGDYADLEEFYEACKELHQDEKDPEFMFQDFEAPEVFMSLISEYGINPDIYELAEAMEDKDADMINAFLSCGYDLTVENIEKAEDSFYGYFATEAELGEDYAENTGMLSAVPENIQRYFDFEAFGRDLAFDFQNYDGYYFYN